jgi:hypothetical protein
MNKLTEDEVINILLGHLTKNGWTIDSHCLGQTHGCDIVASKTDKRLIIESKGARAGDNSPTKRREQFNSGQIKTHFGKALVKVLEEKHLNPQSKFAIAQPNDKDIKKSIGHLIPFLQTLGIKHYWVSADGTVLEE